LDLIRSGGHVSYEGHDVQTDRRHTRAARDLDLTETALREWVKRARARKLPRQADSRERNPDKKELVYVSADGALMSVGFEPGPTWRSTATTQVQDSLNVDLVHE
jgi:hypothetical protein